MTIEEVAKRRIVDSVLSAKELWNLLPDKTNNTAFLIMKATFIMHNRTFDIFRG